MGFEGTSFICSCYSFILPHQQKGVVSSRLLQPTFLKGKVQCFQKRYLQLFEEKLLQHGEKSEPALLGHLTQVLNLFLQQASGYREMRMAAGWVAPPANYHLHWGSGTLSELQGQQLAIPFVKRGQFWHTCSEHFETPSKALSPTITHEVHRYWILLGLVCDMRPALCSPCAFFCLL